jgi:hypothetical protein
LVVNHSSHSAQPIATKLALDIPGPQAAGLVAMDVALGLFLVGLTAMVAP